MNIDGVELNLSCPNVKAGCLAFGTTYDGVKEVTSKVRKVLDKPLIVKLTPNVTDITLTAKAAEDAGRFHCYRQERRAYRQFTPHPTNSD